ncbi:MAG: hypothetical protein IPN44_02970 [Flavobacteriales bacterium]|nr:hypothetical protein [Flavobacteriales bacterium]
MWERISQWWDLLPDGGSGIFLLLIELVVALTAMGWAYNRGYRNTERGPILRLPLLTVAFGLALLVKHLHEPWWAAAVIAVGVVVAGFLGRNDNGRGLGLPVMLVAALLGFGMLISAAALTLVAMIAYLLSPVKKR